MIPCRTLIIAPGQGSFQDDRGVTNWYYKNNESVITISALQKIVHQGPAIVKVLILQILFRP
jgi:hypothetical protein